MRLEAFEHSDVTFLTLTYADQHLPRAYDEESDLWIPTLVKSQLQSFLKCASQKMKRAGYRPLRYFASGEYGEKTLRPHYHAIMYGAGVEWTERFLRLWGRGHVSLYPATPAAMSYVAKYCLKGSKDAELLSSRFSPFEEQRLTQEPFRLMSRRPALGTTSKETIIQSLGNVPKECLVSNNVCTVRIGKDRYPLDRTMRENLEGEFNSVYPGAERLISKVFKQPDYEQTDEETLQAYQGHCKAIRHRHSKARL